MSIRDLRDGPGGAEPALADGAAALYFDLASPYTYLAAERADRLFAQLSWCPAVVAHGASDRDADRDAVLARAAQLRMPLVWPTPLPRRVSGAMRVVSLAAERGVGAQFVLAAGRLMFCGDYDIEDPGVLAVAAGVAGIPRVEALSAARDLRRDEPIERTGRRLLVDGADQLPAVRVGGTLFCGEGRLDAAAAQAGQARSGRGRTNAARGQLRAV